VPVKAPPTGDAWLHEPKLDGYRLQIIKEGRDVRLYSRRGNDWTKRLETTAAALQGLACGSATIDAETRAARRGRATRLSRLAPWLAIGRRTARKIDPPLKH
jgi:bifunctional non-homologous end joining protein LigD